MDTTTVDALLKDLEVSLAEYLESNGKHFNNVLSQTKLNYDPMMAMRHNCDTHIDYIIPTNDLVKKNLYTTLIAKECNLQGIHIDVREGVEEWRQQLRASVALEARIALLKKVRQWKHEGILKVPLIEFVELLIPCLLHLENRVGEKLLTMILRKATELCSTSKKQFLDSLELFFQTEILGSPTSPAHWTLPREGRNESMTGKITGRNEMIRHMIKHVDSLIAVAFPPDHPIRQQLLQSIDSYHSAIKLLTSHYFLSDEDIEMFQVHADNFFENSIELFGIEGVTNYINLLGSGHMQYFLKKYGCLYLYSQQGWEAMMGKVQAFMHWNTQRGGKVSGGGKTKSSIYPVMLYVLRDLLWKTGDAQRFFLDKE